MAGLRDKRKVIISGMLGNGLEWYDYALYGHLSFVISKLFFPTADVSTGLILTFLTFGAGFVSRPLGAIFFGRLGDKFGRKRALTTSMILMAVSTGSIGILPTYAAIGTMAPVLLLVIRILQGISLGGAFSGSMSYVVEHAPADQRSRAGGFILLSLVIGFLSGSLVSTLVTSLVGTEALFSWGWRIPFVLGVGIGFVGFYIRNHAEESPIYEQAKREGTLSATPVRDVFVKYPREMLCSFMMYLFITVPFYVVSIYLIAYSKNHLGLSAAQALLINSVALVCVLVTMYPAAWLGDKIGRKPVLLSAIVATLVLVYPLFLLMQDGVFWHVLVAQGALGLLIGWYQATMPAMLTELFPTSIRYTGMSLACNICAMVGGFAPAVAEWLIKGTGNPISVMWLIVGTGVLAFVGLVGYKDRWREPLRA